MDSQEQWRIEPADFPHAGDAAAKLRFLLGYAILAPSGHNTQPWRFRIDGERLLAFADRSRRLPAVDPDDRALIISVGAAIGTLRVAMRGLGHAGAIGWWPDADDADLVASIELGEAHRPSESDRARLEAIPRRRTTRRDFAPEPLPPDLAGKIESLAERSATISLISEESAKRAIAELVAAGDRAQFADPAFRSELARWVRSRRARSRDGMSGANFGFPDLASPIGAAIIRTIDMGRSIAEADRQRVCAAPALALVASAGDRPVDWACAGAVHAEMLLDVTVAGLTAAYCNQPIETAALRPELARTAQVEGWPQLLLRLGKGPAIAPAVRRPVSAVLGR